MQEHSKNSDFYVGIAVGSSSLKSLLSSTLCDEVLIVWFSQNSEHDWAVLFLVLYLYFIRFFFFFSLELMISLLTHDDLCVVQTEFSLYLLLRSWLFMQIEKDLEFQANSFDENATVHNFFRTLPNGQHCQCYYLLWMGAHRSQRLFIQEINWLVVKASFALKYT